MIYGRYDLVRMVKLHNLRWSLILAVHRIPTRRDHDALLCPLHATPGRNLAMLPCQQWSKSNSCGVHPLFVLLSRDAKVEKL